MVVSKHLMCLYAKNPGYRFWKTQLDVNNGKMAFCKWEYWDSLQESKYHYSEWRGHCHMVFAVARTPSQLGCERNFYARVFPSKCSLRGCVRATILLWAPRFVHLLERRRIIKKFSRKEGEAVFKKRIYPDILAGALPHVGLVPGDTSSFRDKVHEQGYQQSHHLAHPSLKGIKWDPESKHTHPRSCSGSEKDTGPAAYKSALVWKSPKKTPKASWLLFRVAFQDFSHQSGVLLLPLSWLEIWYSHSLVAM